MKLKKLLSALCGMAMFVSLLCPVYAAENNKETVDLGDGFYAVITIDTCVSSRSGNTVNGSKTGKIYTEDDVLIGSATLKAAFDISGSSAKATAAYIIGSGSNNWSYDHGTTRLSGNTAYGTAYFTFGSTQKTLPLSISCSPSGTLS